MWLALDSVTRCAAAWRRDRGHCRNEVERAESIAVAPRRAQFLAGRWLAASMLAERFGGANGTWQMSSEPGRKPTVCTGPAGAWPHLSIAHRGDAVVCAMSMQPVGVDVELEGRLQCPTAGHAELVLSPAERAEFALVAPVLRESFLLERWTLKEAWAKASGRGVVLGEMPGIHAQALREGGNARLWRAPGLVLALSANDPHAWPRPAGGGLDAQAAAAWQVGVLERLA
jgi:4'-phosphopantetheinyl transferase